MKAKPKQQPHERSTARKILLDAKGPTIEEPKELLKQWNESVERLKGTAFTSVTEAIEAIVNEVLQSSGSVEDQEAKDLLRLLFESDPHLVDTVERLLVRSGRP